MHPVHTVYTTVPRLSNGKALWTTSDGRRMSSIKNKHKNLLLSTFFFFNTNLY